MTSIIMLLRHVKIGPGDSELRAASEDLCQWGDIRRDIPLLLPSYVTFTKHRPPWTLLEKCFVIKTVSNIMRSSGVCQASFFFAHSHTKRRTRRWGKPMIPTRYVINHHSGGWVADVTGDEAAETLLSGCIPELQPNLWPAVKWMWEGGAFHDPARGWKENKNFK